jgi:hypothetical protein
VRVRPTVRVGAAVIGSNGGSAEHVYPNVVEGVVEAINERGIRIDGEWLNVSKFKPVAMPGVGELVRIKVQPKGFINSLEVVKALDGPAEHTTAGVARDERIARLAVLKAAANFLGEMSHTHPDVRSEHVIVLADKWLKWVNHAD